MDTKSDQNTERDYMQWFEVNFSSESSAVKYSIQNKTQIFFKSLTRYLQIIRKNSTKKSSDMV